MKAREVIDAALSDWHQVDAARMADDTFGQLEQDDLDRLARRAWTEEWRTALRAKDSNGVPKFASIEIVNPDGESARVYKQTALFTLEDYDVAIGYHRAEAAAHIRTAKSLARQRNALLGLDIPLPGLDIAEESA